MNTMQETQFRNRIDGFENFMEILFSIYLMMRFFFVYFTFRSYTLLLLMEKYSIDSFINDEMRQLICVAKENHSIIDCMHFNEL